jgi:hypothetical protein
MEEDRLNGFDHEPDKHADDEYYEDLAFDLAQCCRTVCPATLDGTADRAWLSI